MSKRKGCELLKRELTYSSPTDVLTDLQDR
jgi:hypothetical protein